MPKIKIMKGVLNKLKAGEKGQAMILALILMAVGGLTIAPMMSFMGTGLIAGQTFEDRMMTLYAADAGAEDALWKIKNDQVSDGSSYPLTVNNRDVVVEVVLEEDIEQFLKELLDKNYSAGVHDEWTVIAGVLVPGVYQISVTYDPPGPGHENKKIDGVGAWFLGHYDYIPESAYGMTDEIGSVFTQTNYKGGTSFRWEFDNPGLEFAPGDTKTQTFEFTPTEEPVFYFSWFWAGSADIGIVPEAATFEIWGIIVTATNSATGRQSRVVAYMSKYGEEAPYSSSIIIWETNPSA